MTLLKQVIRLKSLRVVLATLGALTLVVGVKPELFQARPCSPYHRVNNSSRMECESSAD